MFFHQNRSCDSLFDPSRTDSSNEGSQHKFSQRNKETCCRIIFERNLIQNSWEENSRMA